MKLAKALTLDVAKVQHKVDTTKKRDVEVNRVEKKAQVIPTEI